MLGNRASKAAVWRTVDYNPHRESQRTYEGIGVEYILEILRQTSLELLMSGWFAKRGKRNSRCISLPLPPHSKLRLLAMDFLKAEIQSKKRQLDDLSSRNSHSPAPSTSTSTTTQQDEPPTKRYLKRSELEAMRLQEQKEREQEKERLRKEKLYGKKPKQPLLDTVQGDHSSRGGSSEVESIKEEKTFNVSNDEAVRRLRKIGQPIRLFAESDKDRRLRLRALELIEERSEGQRNDFARAMEGQELGIEREKEKKKGAGEKQDKKDQAKKEKLEKEAEEDKEEKESGKEVKVKEKKEPNPKDEEVLVDLNLVKTNPHKVYPQIYHALKVRSHSTVPSASSEPDFETIL